MSKQTSSEISTIASRVMSMAQRGGPLQVHREGLLGAMESAIKNPRHYPQAVTDDQRRLDALQTILKPYIDAAESLAASALAQDETQGQTGGR